MVGVMVGDQDIGDPFAFCRLEDRLQMFRQVRSGIDHGDLAMADDVGACAFEREGARIVGDNPSDQRGDLIADAILEGDISYEGYHPPSTPERSYPAARPRPRSSPRLLAPDMAWPIDHVVIERVPERQ